MKKARILFVCMGNICRSPSAEGVMRKLVEQAGLQARVELDSAGTHAYHIGEPPDRRSQAAAKARGYELAGLRARKVEAADFVQFDLLLAMDADNLGLLRSRCPPHLHGKLQLMMDYADKYPATEVGDPYYEGAEGFELVLDYLEDACGGLLRAVTSGGDLIGKAEPNGTSCEKSANMK